MNHWHAPLFLMNAREGHPEGSSVLRLSAISSWLREAWGH